MSFCERCRRHLHIGTERPRHATKPPSSLTKDYAELLDAVDTLIAELKDLGERGGFEVDGFEEAAGLVGPGFGDRIGCVSDGRWNGRHRSGGLTQRVCRLGWNARWIASPDPAQWRPMADPLALVAARLAPAFEASPATRSTRSCAPSDRADAQSNGALPSPSARPQPAGGRQAVVEPRAGLDGVVEASRSPGRASSTSRSPTRSSPSSSPRRRPTTGSACAADGRAETVVVDYSAPNVAKEMHVGHLRTTIIGDALVPHARRSLGHRVIRENHIGDWGTPFGMLIEHLLDVGETEAAARAVASATSNGFYQRPRRQVRRRSTDFKERARAAGRAAAGAATPGRCGCGALLVDESHALLRPRSTAGSACCSTDEDIAGESGYNDRCCRASSSELERAGPAAESATAPRCVFPPGFTNREGEPLPLIVRKRDGGFGYATTDLAAHVDRVERLGRPTLLLYVVGAPQAQHLRWCSRSPRMAGWLRAAGAGRARRVRQRARPRPQDVQEPQRRDGQADRAARRGRRAGRRGGRREEPGADARRARRGRAQRSASAR